MTNQEDALGRRVAVRLDDGLAAIDEETLGALRRIRERALLAQRPDRAFSWLWNLASTSPGRGAGFRHPNPARMVSIGALIVALAAGAAYWRVQSVKIDELADVDAGLLAGDLPIDAYLDKGLDSWLTRSPQ